MFLHKGIFIFIVIYAVGEAAIFTYFSVKPLDLNVPYETSSFYTSSKILCSQKCLEHQCYLLEFDDTENTCSIGGKVTNIPSSVGHIIEDTFRISDKEVNLVQPSFKVDASSHLKNDLRFVPEKGIDGDLDTFFHTQPEDLNPWWSIDLERLHAVWKIGVTMRASGALPRFSDVSIYFSNVPETEPTKFKDLPLWTVGRVEAVNWNISSTATPRALIGRYMYLVLTNVSRFEFSEIEIYGCFIET